MSLEFSGFQDKKRFEIVVAEGNIWTTINMSKKEIKSLKDLIDLMLENPA